MSKASLNYSNRMWEAWFAIEIPLQEGPYVFKGTPGLIIYLRDTKDHYVFSFIGIKKDETTDIDYLSVKPIDISKIQLNKVLIDHYNDPYRELKSGQIKARWQYEDGKEFTPNYNELTRDEQKNIKKYNNPIELSEVIKYP
ncbi:GLPGLI family protein [Elizabethkingia argentiflava]|uniref:GLPGLI family protein n=1 Tax=Elizabethkingia argenteiflava TaxID=2681556 RepID=A0A845PU87_9FLAO|nr:GLPGLI family protein [Elizabethkingia argenteiflava]NAW51215.1 GLPGLI family protein [Elizabethkingia argenteiflava]